MVNRMKVSIKATKCSLHHQVGLTMVELLVAISLGIFLAWGAIEAFLSGRQTYIIQQALSRIQENARMAQELIGYDIRSAGSYGCAAGKGMGDADDVNFLPGSTHTTVAVSTLGAGSTNPTAEHNFAFAVFATNNVSGAANADTMLLANLNPAPLAGTDVLIAHTATDLGAEILAAPAPTTTQFRVPNRGFLQTDILSVASCSGNFIFRPTAVTNTTPQVITHPQRRVLPDASFPIKRSIASEKERKQLKGLSPGQTVMRLDAPIYYVANNPAGTPSLYRRLIGGNSEELLSGVQDMQIEVGIDLDNDSVVDEFRTPNNVTAAQWNAWNDANGDDDIQEVLDKDGNVIPSISRPVRVEENVVAIRYSLLLRSDETNLVEDPQPYTFNGVLTTPTDRRLRQVVTSTVGIRSRLNN